MPQFTTRRLSTPVAFLALSVALTLPAAVRAQDVFDAKTAEHIRISYLNDLDTLHAKITALAKAIPEDKYSWRPAPGTRSVSEALMHVVSEFYFYGPRSIGGNPPADFGVPKEAIPALEKVTGKAQVIAALDKSWAHTKSEFAKKSAADLTGKIKPWNLPLDEAMLAMTDDLHEHLGQMIVYARSVGVKPPWTK